MQSRVLIFCGKGGVGKTTLALAHGFRLANQGRRALVVSSHPLPELAIAVSLEGINRRFPDAARNLFVVHINAKELLAEIVQKNFPMEWLANAVLNSKIYQNLIEVAPGLKEFYFLARLQSLAERTAPGGLQYDVLIWDAPSTGHFLSTLGAAKNFETFLSGPLASAGAELHRFFSNIGNVALLPTTTLEEMAIEEMMEMCAKLETDFALKPTAVVANMVSPVATADEKDFEALLNGTTLSDNGFRFALSRAATEREHVSNLRARLGTPIAAVERVRDVDSDLDLLQVVGDSLEGTPLFA